MVVDYFKSIPTARVRTFVCADIGEQLAAIELAQLGETFNKQKIQEIRDRKAWFVLVDMTDIRNFWETVLLGYVESLQQQLAGPAPPERPLRGLLIIDEAKDLVLSGKSVPCKASILRLVAQARKYGLGLIFATQAPKSIDHNIIANCSTHYYGKASSPAAIDAIREQLKSRGGSGHDIATLKTGCFYVYTVYTEGLQAPVKVSIPLCLSYHPASPLDETEVLKRAVRSHGLLFALDKYQRFG